MTPPAGFRAAGGVWLREAAEPRLARLALATLSEAFAHPARRRGKYKALARLEDGSGAVWLKRWDFDRREVWLRAALKGGNFPVFDGLRELENLLGLARAGLRVPEPLAAGTEVRGARRRSFVVLAELPGRPWDEAPPPPEPRARRERVRALAALARALHAGGFWHRDLYLCNVYDDPALGLGLLDCERVCWRAEGPPRRWRVKDLAALDYSAGRAWSQPERLRFLRAYLGIRRLDEEGRALARAVRRKARHLARHGQKR